MSNSITKSNKMIQKRQTSTKCLSIPRDNPSQGMIFIEYCCIPSYSNTNAVKKTSRDQQNKKSSPTNKTIPPVKSISKPLLFHNIHYESSSSSSSSSNNVIIKNQKKKSTQRTSCNYSLEPTFVLNSPSTNTVIAFNSSQQQQQHCTVSPPPGTLPSNQMITSSSPCISTALSLNEQYKLNSQTLSKSSKDSQSSMKVLDTTYQYHENGSCLFHWKNWQESSTNKEISKPIPLFNNLQPNVYNEERTQEPRRISTPEMSTFTLMSHSSLGFVNGKDATLRNNDSSSTPPSSVSSELTLDRNHYSVVVTNQDQERLPSFLDHHDEFFRNHQHDQVVYLPPLQYGIS